MIRYEQTQRASFMYLPVIIGAAIAVGFLALKGEYAGMTAVLIAPVLMLLLFGSLTVRIDESALTISYGIGLIRRRVPLDDIAAAEQTRTKWYEGWGIRITSRGWLYNISGLDAVLMTRRNGRTFLVGTEEPQRLHAALVEAISGSRHG
jgi:hypothetical protein